jgi:23S rRNA (uracil1939-C5)-methyltransferase
MKSMALGEFFTASVNRIAAGGAGVLSLEGRNLFMDLTAPGDTVRGRVTEEHKNWAKAELVEILEPSPLRETPACPLYGKCGGCSLQHLSYEAQLAEKAAIIKDAFLRIGGFSVPPELRIRRSQPFEYRNRAQFHCPPPLYGAPVFKNRRGIPAGEGRTKAQNQAPGGPGFMARKSGELIPLPDCPAADPGIRRALLEGILRPPPGRDRFAVYSRNETFLCQGGAARGRVSFLGKELLIDAGVFFQSNGAALETLIRDLQEFSNSADRSLPMADIYCGVGTFAAFLGEAFPRTDLVEENRTALALAKENLRVRDKRFFALTDTAWVKSMAGKRGAWGFMILDPPRQGLSPPLRQWLAEKGPPFLAYVSCDPATLARDSRDLAGGGYKLENLTFYDFYPQTAHIESLAAFRKGALDRGFAPH